MHLAVPFLFGDQNARGAKRSLGSGSMPLSLPLTPDHLPPPVVLTLTLPVPTDILTDTWYLVLLPARVAYNNTFNHLYTPDLLPSYRS